jgi:hypothetical protein
MKSFSRIAIPAAVTATLLACGAPAAGAAASKYIRYLRPLGSAPQDGQGILGPGGATRLRGIIDQTLLAPQLSVLGAPFLSATVTVNVPGCGTPFTSTSDDTFLVVWPTACVFSGNAATLFLSTTGDAIIPVRSFYANAAGDSIAPAIPTTVTPGSGPPLLAALTALLALAGGVALIGRRRATAG